MESGFVQMKRTEETKELMKDKNAFILLTQIALRAKRTSSFSVHGLEIGEALVGDHKEIGLSRGEYRGAIKRLENHQLITTKKTNKGTIAKLINSDVFNINEEKRDHQEINRFAREEPSQNHRPTTNNNENNFNNDKNKTKRFTNLQGGKNERRFGPKIVRNESERNTETRTKKSKYDCLSKELSTGR